jgi:cell division protein FtsW
MPDILAKLRRGKAGPEGPQAPDEKNPSAAADGGKDTGKDAAETAAKPAQPKRQGPRARFGAWLGRPMTSFHLVIACAALLITLGLTMVLSASGVHSYDEDGSPWTIFAKQVLWTVIGLIAFYVALRLPIAFMRRMALPAFIVSLVLIALVLIPGIGHLSNGARGWFVVAGFSMQPSELTKIAFAIWGSHLLATRRMQHAGWKELLFPLVPAAVLALGLIVAEPDLGQTVSVSIVLLGLLWYAGLSLRIFLSSLILCIGAAAIMAVSAGYRSDRVRAWLDPDSDLQGIGYQSRQAKYALANGGMFGDGLGQGTAKFNYLPNAHNDFIFAIIGEELGFIGAAGLLALFGLFAYTGMRIARRSVDPFLRLLTATTTLWVVGQVFINVGYVLGLLPVTGIQLPLISAGGTATATTLLLIGLIANAARHEPDAVAALRAGRRRCRIRRPPWTRPGTGCVAGETRPATSRSASPPPGRPNPPSRQSPPSRRGPPGRPPGRNRRPDSAAPTPRGARGAPRNRTGGPTAAAVSVATPYRPTVPDGVQGKMVTSRVTGDVTRAGRTRGSAHWKVSGTGEWCEFGPRRAERRGNTPRRAERRRNSRHLRGAGRRRHRRSHRARDGGCRRAGGAAARRPDHRPRHGPRAGNPAGPRTWLRPPADHPGSVAAQAFCRPGPAATAGSRRGPRDA